MEAVINTGSDRSIPYVAHLPAVEMGRDVKQRVAGNQAFGSYRVASSAGEIDLIGMIQSIPGLIEFLLSSGVAISYSLVNALRSLTPSELLNLLQAAKADKVNTASQLGLWLTANWVVKDGKLVLRSTVTAPPDNATRFKPPMPQAPPSGQNQKMPFLRRQPGGNDPDDSSTKTGGLDCTLKTKTDQYLPGEFTITGIGESKSGGLVELKATINSENHREDPWDEAMERGYVELPITRLEQGSTVEFVLRCDNNEAPAAIKKVTAE